MLATLTKMSARVEYLQDKKPVGRDVYEGEVPMSGQQQDAYKQIIGDGQASVTVSRELSESDYGNGGKVFVSITLTCDQSAQGLHTAVEWAKGLAEAKAWEYHAQLKQQLVDKGILRP